MKTNNQHIEFEQLLAYYKEELSLKDVNTFKKHIDACEECQNVLEAIETFDVTELRKPHLEEVEKQLDDKLQEITDKYVKKSFKKRSGKNDIQSWLIMVAATILLVIIPTQYLKKMNVKIERQSNLVIVETGVKYSTPSPPVVTRAIKSKVDKPIASTGENIQFTDKTREAESWLWDFGDGTTSTQRNPKHTYAYPGEYMATLKVNGSRVKSRHYIRVNGYIALNSQAAIRREEVKPVLPRPPALKATSKVTHNTVGSAAAAYSTDCLSPSTGNYSFSITPRQDIELISFKVGSNECGGLNVTLSSTKGTRSTKSALIAGQSQISLDGFYLEAGRTYTISCSTMTGYGACGAIEQPVLQDSSSCASPRSSSHFTADYRGKSIIHELRYLY